MENIEFNNVIMLDIISIIIIVAFILVNYFRGFTKTAISVVGYILAVVLGSILGDMSAQNLYDSAIKQGILSNIQTVLKDNDVIESINDKVKEVTYGIDIGNERLSVILSSPDSMYNTINTNGNEFLSMESIDNLLSETIDETIGESLRAVVPTSAVDYVINTIKSNQEALYGLTSALTKDNEYCAEYLEENFIAPIVVYIVKIAIFTIVFFITMIIAKIISSSVHDVDVFPGMTVSLDRFLGAIAGLIEAIVLLLLLCIFLKWIVSVNVGNSRLFDSVAIEQDTILFKYIYNIDTLKLLTNVETLS